MIKSSSSACNLACDYCFYQETASHREVGQRPFMKDDVMMAIITKGLTEAKNCSFVFQGGEPSLIGLSFYEKFVETVNRLNTDGGLPSTTLFRPMVCISMRLGPHSLRKIIFW